MCVCVCVSDTSHLVPGTNYRIEGLSLANSGTKIGKLWNYLWKTLGLTVANSGTHFGNQLDGALDYLVSRSQPLPRLDGD